MRDKVKENSIAFRQYDSDLYIIRYKAIQLVFNIRMLDKGM